MKQKNSCQMYKIIKNGKFMGIGTYPKGLVELCSGFEVIEKENKMKFKVGDKVIFNSGFGVGLGTVVAVNTGIMLYLVHSDDITWGHSGGSHENGI